jgi:DNA repair protein RadA/Sms
MAIFKCGGQWVLDDYCGRACTYESELSWRGSRCPECGCYYDVRRVGAVVSADKSRHKTAADYKGVKYDFVSTGSAEVDRVLCGGIVLGKSYLIGGSRGSGKTTLLLTTCDNISSSLERNVLYASGEESGHSVGATASRLGVDSKRLHILGNEEQESNDIDSILQRCKELKAALLILDSAQTTTVGDSKGNEGSGAQINAVMQVLSSYCTEHKMAAFIVSHLEKGGNFAGPETAQHLTDVLLFMHRHEEYDDDGDKKPGEPVRELECFEKNRMGEAGRKAYFEMTEKGLKPVTKSKYLRLVT